jgi:hypothetical protein
MQSDARVLSRRSDRPSSPWRGRDVLPGSSGRPMAAILQPSEQCHAACPRKDRTRPPLCYFRHQWWCPGSPTMRWLGTAPRQALRAHVKARTPLGHEASHHQHHPCPDLRTIAFGPSHPAAMFMHARSSRQTRPLRPARRIERLVGPLDRRGQGRSVGLVRWGSVLNSRRSRCSRNLPRGQPSGRAVRNRPVRGSTLSGVCQRGHRGRAEFPWPVESLP